MRRLAAGGRVDRGAPLGFRFGGLQYQGLEGDTLASALLSNGLDGAFRSPLLGRPRGVMTAGPEEPCAFVEVSAPWFDLIAPATMVPLVDGLAAAARAGVGRLPGPAARTPPSRQRHAHVETLVVGAGVAGLRAAREAAGRGDRVLLVDERSHLGGTARSFETVDGQPAWAWVDAVAGELRAAPDVTLLGDAAALGVYDAGLVVVHQRSAARLAEREAPLQRLWHVRAKRVVLATGAHERPIAFAGNDRPGVMLSGAVLTYLDRFGVLPGERAVVFTTNDAGYQAARALRSAGAEVAVIVDVRGEAAAQDYARADGFGVLVGAVVAATDGPVHVTAGVAVGPDGEEVRLEADLVAVSGGWNPVTQLHRAIGGGLRYAADRSCFVPDGGPAWLEVVGAAAGEVPASEPCWYVTADDLSGHFVDLQRDQTVADVAAALGSGLRSVEHVKRATYIGTAVDQGRASGALAAEIVNQLLGTDPGAQGPTNARPPWSPVAFHVLAGHYRGVVFDAVGQWKRPWYFPRDGETMRAAVLRECAAVRTGVGMIDASTLGKIEVVGPDAPAFLDRMYTNAMSTLGVGRIRYGLMLGVDGMVFDDGVAMRLATDRYLVTTTTGGAAGQGVVLRRAGVRGARRWLARASRVGGAAGGRRAARDHAVRDRDHGRPARGEGVRDGRAGHRRHRDPRRPRDVVDRQPPQGRLRRAALAAARRPGAAGPQAARRAAAGRPRTARLDRARADVRRRRPPRGPRDRHRADLLRPAGGSPRWLTPTRGRRSPAGRASSPRSARRRSRSWCRWTCAPTRRWRPACRSRCRWNRTSGPPAAAARRCGSAPTSGWSSEGPGRRRRSRRSWDARWPASTTRSSTSVPTGRSWS